MTKVSRTFRLDIELSSALDKICVRYGDKTYHIENALRAYIPAAQMDNVTIPAFVKPKPVKVENTDDHDFELFLNNFILFPVLSILETIDPKNLYKDLLSFLGNCIAAEIDQAQRSTCSLWV